MRSKTSAAALSIIFACGLTAPHARAEGKIVTELRKEGSGIETLWAVTFTTEGCEEECLVAELKCDSYRNINFVFGDVTAQDAAGAIVKENQPITITLGGRPHAFSITDLSFSEMTGSWLVASRATADHLEIYDAFAKTGGFTASIEGQTLKLPLTKDVGKWAKTCKQ